MSTEPRRYDFAERVEFAEQLSAVNLRTILAARLPALLAVRRAGVSDDRRGTDYWVERANGLPPLSVDVKIREKDWAKRGRDDVALETWSVCYSRVGWTRDTAKRTDFVMWYWLDTKRFLLIPFPPLCVVFSRHWQEWARVFPTAPQTSGEWESECVFVPRRILIERMGDWCSGSLPN